MRAAIYNPYLDTLGGGERYTIFAAFAFIKAGYSVDIQWPDSGIRGKLETRFGVELGEVNFVGDIKRGDGYDLCFWVSDGSIPNLKARKNILHFQVPFRNVNGGTLINKMKLFRIDKVVCNSLFTKEIIDKEYGVDSLVIYPPVDVSKIKPRKKEDLILYVGRFSELGQVKRQDMLITAFKKFFDAGNDSWKLVIAGGTEVGSASYLKRLKKMKTGYPIEIVESPDFKTLKGLYGRARFFWSAVGYGVNENKEPAKVEHFGISLVEAMAAGAVPIVYNAGGYKEIVQGEQNGFFWERASQIIFLTTRILKDKKLERSLSVNAKATSQKFASERFEEEVLKII